MGRGVAGKPDEQEREDLSQDEQLLSLEPLPDIELLAKGKERDKDDQDKCHPQPTHGNQRLEHDI